MLLKLKRDCPNNTFFPDEIKNGVWLKFFLIGNDPGAFKWSRASALLWSATEFLAIMSVRGRGVKQNKTGIKTNREVPAVQQFSE